MPGLGRGTCALRSRQALRARSARASVPAFRLSGKVMTDKKLTSADVRAKHKQYLFSSQATYYEESVVLESGKGSWVKDLDGSRYLDFFGGILTVSLGHANERV